MAVEAGIESSIWNDGISKFVMSPEPLTVHNHLIDTKIYATLGENEFLHARPSSVHFKGYEVGKTYTQKLRIINTSNGCQRMHIIPPSANVFKIYYAKKELLVPGMFLDVTVEFIPNENNYYQDAIRIHSQASSNLIIPIHAYHQMNVASTFPSKLNFKPTMVGQSSQKKFQIKNPTPMDFDFQISFIEKHESYCIEPMSGVIPGDSHFTVTITYSPMEYCTACAKLQVIVSQFNNQPHFCTLMGSSEPGLAARVKTRELEDIPESEVDPRSLSPLGRFRAKKKNCENRNSVIAPEEQKGMVVDGIHFPKDLNNPAAVSYVLTQKAGKMKAKDVRQAMIKQESDMTKSSSKQMKEAVFHHLVGKNIAEEQKNQLRWCVRVGESEFGEDTKNKVFQDREVAENEFKVFRRVGDLPTECNRSSTNILTNQRILRPANQHTDMRPTFDLYLNDEWGKRHRVLTRFIQASRKVILQIRAANNLKYINKHLDSWRKGFFMSGSGEKPKKQSNEELEIVENMSAEFDEGRIKSFGLPEYIDTEKKDDMAVDALGSFDVAAPNVRLKERVETYKLKVAQQYKILSYNQHLLTSSVFKYIPNTLARELRKGAESEVTQTEYSDTTPLATASTFLPQRPITTTTTAKTELEILAIPAEFLEPKNYHPMHVFNPLPGVQAHAQPLLYSEVDDDNKLCPLLQRMGPKSNGQDIVPGVMIWKKFPSQGLMSMSNPTISNVYVPRWSDPFEDEISSSFTPTLLTSLPPDDVMDLDESEEESRIIPTMEMIQKEFKTANTLSSTNNDSCEASISLRENSILPGTNNPQSITGHVQRDSMQKSLDVFLRTRQNALGVRMKSRVETIQSEWNI